MINPEYTPILIIVAFVVYPFAVTGLAVFIISRSGRERFPIRAAKLFALAGCVPPIWFVVTCGFGKIPPVTVIGSAVFVLGAAATGLLLGAILELFVPTSVDAHKRSVETTAEGNVDDEDLNP